MNLLKKIIFSLILLTGFISAQASESHSSESTEEFKPGEMILHHIMDAHEWHFASVGNYDYVIPLPIIIYSEKNGLVYFMSSEFRNAKREFQGYHLDHHEHIHSLYESEKIYDLSITKNVASLLLSALILIIVFTTVAGYYSVNEGKAPTGMQSFFEPIIVFVRDDVAKNVIGKKYERYMPYLLTVFFFIWVNNMLGLLPGGANLTGNIAVTMVLAIFTFIITTFTGNKTYWGHIFNTPGVPLALKPLIIPIEIVGMFTKPFSLMVRLFANITAGHIIILSLLGLIFIFKSIFASLISLPFAIFMSFLELFVALLQAYIFTLLTAMYFGAAVEEHHHEHEKHSSH